MPSTTSYEFGDVVLVPFPFTDQTGRKKRPAVVVSSETFHRESIDLIIMAITTQSRVTSSLQAVVSGWQAAGLLRPSVIKPVFTTIDQELVVKRIGALQNADVNALRDALRDALG